MDNSAPLECNGSEDPLFLQVKEEPNSAYAPYLGEMGAPQHQGRRVVQGQRAMQLQSDSFLGWTSMGGRDYLVRQLHDHKAAITEEELKGRGLESYAEICAELLAKGHARSCDSCAVFGYIGRGPKFDRAIAKFALSYADQTTGDYEAYERSLGGKKRPVKKQKAKSKKKAAAKSKI